MFIDQHLDRLLPMSFGDRSAYLARLDPAIARELRGMLDVDLPGAEDTIPRRMMRERVSAGDLIGGRYRLSKVLGQGSFGEVWKAYDEHLHAWRAIKVFATDGCDRADVLREAQAAANIRNDHVVRIVDAVQTNADPSLYIVMDLCSDDNSDDPSPGVPVSKIPALPMERIAQIVMEAARGAQAAHDQGVLHRDIKPDNILVTPVQGRGQVIDFGVSRALRSPATDPTLPATATMTLRIADGVIAGTPAYMAPEQAEGREHTTRSDIYQLGATLYALLGGRSPYVAGETAEAAALDVIYQVTSRAPTPLREVNPEVPERLAKIVARAMARNPLERYASAKALADDLESWLAGRATSHDGPLTSAQLFLRRNGGKVTVFAAFMAVLFASGSIVSRQYDTISHTQDEAVLARAEAQRERRHASEAELLATRAAEDAKAAFAEAELAKAIAARSEAHAREADAAKRRADKDAQDARDFADEQQALASLATEGQLDARMKQLDAEKAAHRADEAARRADELARRAEENSRRAEDAARRADDRAVRAESNAAAAHEAMAGAMIELESTKAALEELRKKLDALEHERELASRTASVGP